MARWPQYTKEQPVACFRCDTTLEPGKAGRIVGFGHMNGNYVQSCPSCGYKTFYDIADEQAVKAHNEAHGVEFYAVKAGVSNAYALRMARENAQAARKRGVTPIEAGFAPRNTLPTPKQESGAFDLL